MDAAVAARILATVLVNFPLDSLNFQNSHYFS